MQGCLKTSETTLLLKEAFDFSYSKCTFLWFEIPGG